MDAVVKRYNMTCPGCGSIPVPVGDKMKCPGCGKAMDYNAEWYYTVKRSPYAEHVITFLPEYVKVKQFQEQEDVVGSAVVLTVSPEEAERAENALRQSGLDFKRYQANGYHVFHFVRKDQADRARDVLKAAGYKIESITEMKTFAAGEHPGSEFYSQKTGKTGSTTELVGSNEDMMTHEGKPFKVPGAEKTFEYVAQWKGPRSTTTQWKVSESRLQLYENGIELHDSQRLFDVVAYEYLPIHGERLRPYCKHVFLMERFTIFEGIRGGNAIKTVLKYIPDYVKLEFYEYQDKLLCEVCGYPVMGDKNQYVCGACSSIYQKSEGKFLRTWVKPIYFVEAELEQKPVSLYMAVVTGTEDELKDLETKGGEKGLYAEIQHGKLFLKGGKKDLKDFLQEIGLEEKPKEEVPSEEVPKEEPGKEEVPPPEEVSPEEKPAKGKEEIPPEFEIPSEVPKESIEYFVGKDGKIKAVLYEQEEAEEDYDTEEEEEEEYPGEEEEKPEFSIGDTVYSEEKSEKDVTGRFEIEKDAGAPDPEKMVKEPLKQAMKAAGLKRSGKSEAVVLECKCGFRTTKDVLEQLGGETNKCPRCGRLLEAGEYGNLYVQPKPHPWGQDINKDKGAIDVEPDQGGVWASVDLKKDKNPEEKEELKEPEEEETEEARKKKKEREEEKEDSKLEALALNPDQLSDLDVSEVNKLAKAMGYRPLTPGQVKRILLYATQHEDIKQVDKLVDVESPLASLVIGYFLGKFNR